MFGLVVAGRPVLEPAALQTFSPTEYAYTIPATPLFSHIVVFLAPGTNLLADTAVGVFVKFPKGPAPGQEPGFRLLGGLSAEKPSAIFRVRGLDRRGGDAMGHVVGSVNGVAEVDMDAGEPAATAGDITIGLQVQPAAQLAPQLAALTQPRVAAAPAPSGALMPHGPPPPPTGSSLSAKELAQRIIQNAFNYLGSFAEGRPGAEVVPLRSFETWWRKIESRFDSDPGFLEREGGAGR